jgi:hypothetical protein
VARALGTVSLRSFEANKKNKKYRIEIVKLSSDSREQCCGFRTEEIIFGKGWKDLFTSDCKF